jgi:hypothetical protein
MRSDGAINGDLAIGAIDPIIEAHFDIYEAVGLPRQTHSIWRYSKMLDELASGILEYFRK